jgi:hypothetical protein
MSNAAPRSKPSVRPTVPGDCEELAKTMRLEDVEEIFHASGNTPLASLTRALRLSADCFTVVWDGRVVLVFGCSGVAGKYGYPWMLASDDLVRIKKPFLREARQYLQQMEQKYTYLTNYAWSLNSVHLCWLEWMGFKLDPPAPLKEGGELFTRFHKGTYV